VHEKMKKDAQDKRSKHARLIVRCEKKFPVYGFGDINNQQTVKRLQKMKLINCDEKSGGGRDALTEMGGSMPLFDDIDH